MTTIGTPEAELIERLHRLRIVLKSGDYNGADLMLAWCTMIDAADRLQSRIAEVEKLEERVRELEAALKAMLIEFGNEFANSPIINNARFALGSTDNG
jgi:hypothetical protein